MIEMGDKKNPGKFTVRFNLCDPQQRQAAELLNRQGRSKAQFITNAVLHYASGQASIPQEPLGMDSERLRHLVEDILAQHQDQGHPQKPVLPEPSAGKDLLNDAERRVIFQTLGAFQQQ